MNIEEPENIESGTKLKQESIPNFLHNNGNVDYNNWQTNNTLTKNSGFNKAKNSIITYAKNLGFKLLGLAFISSKLGLRLGKYLRTEGEDALNRIKARKNAKTNANQNSAQSQPLQPSQTSQKIVNPVLYSEQEYDEAEYDAVENIQGADENMGIKEEIADAIKDPIIELGIYALRKTRRIELMKEDLDASIIEEILNELEVFVRDRIERGENNPDGLIDEFLKQKISEHEGKLSSADSQLDEILNQRAADSKESKS